MAKSDIEKVKAFREELDGARQSYQEYTGAVNTLLAQAKEKYGLDSLQEVGRAIEDTRKSKERAEQILASKIAELEAKYDFS